MSKSPVSAEATPATLDTEACAPAPSEALALAPALGEVFAPALGGVSAPALGEVSALALSEATAPALGEAAAPVPGEGAGLALGEVSGLAINEAACLAASEAAGPAPGEAAGSAPGEAAGSAPGEAAAGEAPSWTDGAGGPMGQIRGALGLLRDGIDGVTCLVRDVHMAIASKPFDVLSYAPVAAEGAAVVRPLYEGLTGAVYGSVRLVNRLVFAGIDGALSAAEEQKKRQSAP